MKNNHFQKVWRVPLLLALSIFFGLLSALLGTGIWHYLAWTALLLPLAVLFWKMLTAFSPRKSAPASA